MNGLKTRIYQEYHSSILQEARYNSVLLFDEWRKSEWHGLISQLSTTKLLRTSSVQQLASIVFLTLCHVSVYLPATRYLS